MTTKSCEKINTAKPILKWAGGKSQLLPELLPKVPKKFGKYIEPFVGGGAMFFALRPKTGIIADSNPELINLYQQIAENVDQVIRFLQGYENTSKMFYEIRALDWTRMPASEAAARTIYLNKTCYNGLYRVNRNGGFNTPYGRYKNPKICDETALREAAEALRGTTILCADYQDVLKDYAKPGDFIFLDPPYIPVSEYGDFKRYTKEQFREEDHRRLAAEVERLYNLGCYVLLANSNHPLVHELYGKFPMDIVQTRRYISCKGDKRKGEDVIVSAFPIKKAVQSSKRSLSEQVSKYPATRFMGSKRKLLSEIWNVAAQFEFRSVLDLFSGSGVVGYMFKCQGKKVVCNDHLTMSQVFAKAMVENNKVILPKEEAKYLLKKHKETDRFVETTFKGLYFSDSDNQLIDILRTNIWEMEDEYKQAIALSALIRACTKKRPRGIFTYTGERYNDGRRDLRIPLDQQFIEAVEAVNGAVFDNGEINLALSADAMVLETEQPDLVYIDPPYFSMHSDNEYVRRYHFVEGLARDWKGVEIQEHTKTKKFKSYPTPFSTRDGAEAAFESLFKKYKDSILLVSYSSNCLPTQEEMVCLLKKYKRSVEIIPIDYKYAFGNQRTAQTHRNTVQEYLFLGY